MQDEIIMLKGEVREIKDAIIKLAKVVGEINIKINSIIGERNENDSDGEKR